MKNLLYDFNGRANSETLIQPAFQRFVPFEFVPFRDCFTKPERSLIVKFSEVPENPGGVVEKAFPAPVIIFDRG